MVLCDYDCFNCSYSDCIQPYNSITGTEKRLSKELDEESIGVVRKNRREYMRAYQREYYYGKRRHKMVKRIGNGEEVIFKSIKDAAKSVNGFSPPISECCRGKRKSIYGYKWEFVIGG